MAKGKGCNPVGGKNYKHVGRVDSDTKEGKDGLKQAMDIAKRVKTSAK